MLTAPIAKAILEMKLSANVVIWDYQSYFEIAIDGESIAPQRMTSPPQARKFKTLAAAYSYLRNFLDYERGITILIAPWPELRYRHYDLIIIDCTKHLEQRHKMMQHWSDYLDGLQADNVVAVKFGGAS